MKTTHANTSRTPLPWHVECPPYPAAGYPHDFAREEWRNAHAAIAEAEYWLDPQRLASSVASLHKYAQMMAEGRGRKPSGDLRHPVPRDYIESTTEAQRAQYEAKRDGALKIVRAIENGDVVDVRGSFSSRHGTSSFYDDSGQMVHDLEAEAEAALDELFSRPRLVMRGEDEADAVRKAETLRVIAEEMARIENMDDAQVTEYLREYGVTESKPVLYHGEKPETLEEYTAALRYRDKGRKIEAKAAKDAATKVRTAARRAAEEADPVGTKAAKLDKARSKAKDRQQRFRSNETSEQAAERKAKDAAAARARRAAKARR